MSPVEISFSRVQAYERCPWLYHLVYDEGWRSGPTGPAALGQSLHRALADYLLPSNSERTLDRLLELFDQHWVNEGFSSPQQTIEIYERGRKMLEHFFELDRSRSTKVVATEKEFNYEIAAGVSFRGTMDRIDRLPDGNYEIIEYKTGAEPWPEQRITNDKQMTFYALGFRKLFGQAPLKLTYFFLSSGQSVSTERTPQQLEEAHTLILTIADKIRAGEFTPNHAHCPRCEFKKRCSKFKPS